MFILLYACRVYGLNHNTNRLYVFDLVYLQVPCREAQCKNNKDHTICLQYYTIKIKQRLRGALLNYIRNLDIHKHEHICTRRCTHTYGKKLKIQTHLATARVFPVSQ